MIDQPFLPCRSMIYPNVPNLSGQSQGHINFPLAIFHSSLLNIAHYFDDSPPARWGLLDFIRVVLLLLRVLLLFYDLCLHFHVHCCLANSWPSSSPTSELSAHCWTSTWDLPSSVRTAGPQPGTFLAQRAPLDLNLGPAELSAHRWTSTWGLPSSVRTAGPQKPDRMPDRMSDRMREDMPDKMP